MVQPMLSGLLAERIAAASPGRIGVSRALPPDVKRHLLALDGATELPALRGRTVVPEQWSGSVVFGHPNYFGRFEPPTTVVREIRITGAWAVLEPVPSHAMAIEREAPVPAEHAAARLDSARRLAKRLEQLPGVQIAVRPQSPVVLVLLPISIDDGGMPIAGVTVLGPAFPEFPGGIRVEFPVGVIGEGIVRYADDLERRLAREART